MVNLKRPKDFSSKFHELGSSSQEHFMLCFNRVWLKLLDVHATGEEEIVSVRGTIMGSNKVYKAMYSRSDDAIYLDIIDS